MPFLYSFAILVYVYFISLVPFHVFLLDSFVCVVGALDGTHFVLLMFQGKAFLFVGDRFFFSFVDRTPSPRPHRCFLFHWYNALILPYKTILLPTFASSLPLFYAAVLFTPFSFSFVHIFRCTLPHQKDRGVVHFLRTFASTLPVQFCSLYMKNVHRVVHFYERVGETRLPRSFSEAMIALNGIIVVRSSVQLTRGGWTGYRDRVLMSGTTGQR